jgi:hypothetical protein
MEGLLGPTSVPDLQALDQLAISGWRDSNQGAINLVTSVLRERSDAFEIASQLLQGEGFSIYSKMCALVILREFVRLKWPTLSPENADSLRTYIVSFILQPSTPPFLVGSASSVMVEILKFEWPQPNATLVRDMIAHVHTSPDTLQNMLALLKMLAQELSDFSDYSLTTFQIAEMTAALQSEFPQILLLLQVGLCSDREPVVREALATLRAMFHASELARWTDGSILEMISTELLPNTAFTLDCLAVFGEIASILVERHPLVTLFHQIVHALTAVIPENVFDPTAGLSKDFVYNFAVSMTALLIPLLGRIETLEREDSLTQALSWLYQIAEAGGDAFLPTIDLWVTIAKSSYHSPMQVAKRVPPVYEPLLPALRRLLIRRMDQPSDVLVTITDDDTPARRMVANTQESANSGSLREALVYLANLDRGDMITAFYEHMGEVRAAPVALVNGFCWAVGAVSGALPEEE